MANCPHRVKPNSDKTGLNSDLFLGRPTAATGVSPAAISSYRLSCGISPRRLLRVLNSSDAAEFVLARNMSKHKEAKKGDEGQLTGRDSCSTSDLGAVAEAESFVPRSKSNRAKFVVMRAPESERYRPPAEQLLSTYRDTQQEELKSIIAAKEQELEVVRQKEQSTRKRLTEEVKYLDQNNNALRKQNEELQSCERKLRQSIEKLQVELGECQSKLRRRNNMVSSATETEPAIAANGECQCRQLQERA